MVVPDEAAVLTVMTGAFHFVSYHARVRSRSDRYGITSPPSILPRYRSHLGALVAGTNERCVVLVQLLCQIDTGIVLVSEKMMTTPKEWLHHLHYDPGRLRKVGVPTCVIQCLHPHVQ